MRPDYACFSYFIRFARLCCVESCPHILHDSLEIKFNINTNSECY